MKKVFLLMMLSLMLGALNAQNTSQIDTLLNQMDTDGKKFGYWEHRQGNNLVYTGRYVDNIKEGQWIKLTANKLVLNIENYKHGKLEGSVVAFDSRGRLKSRTEYREGVKHGDMYKYNQTGHNLAESAKYKFGLLDGRVRLFYDNGRPQEDGFYKNGLRDGTTKWFDYKGKLIAEFNYKNGLFSGEQKTYYPSGKLKTEEVAEFGEPVGERKEYYETGKLKLKGAYKNGKRHGTWLKYSPNGSGTTELIYKNGKLK